MAFDVLPDGLLREGIRTELFSLAERQDHSEFLAAESGDDPLREKPPSGARILSCHMNLCE
jgi:hypothetical protein